MTTKEIIHNVSLTLVVVAGVVLLALFAADCESHRRDSVKECIAGGAHPLECEEAIR